MYLDETNFRPILWAQTYCALLVAMGYFVPDEVENPLTLVIVAVVVLPALAAAILYKMPNFSIQL